MDFKDLDPSTIFIFSIVAIAIALATFYYIIKAAVKNGILEADAIKNEPPEDNSDVNKG